MCLSDGVSCLEQVLRTTFGLLSGLLWLCLELIGALFSIPLVVTCRGGICFFAW